MLKVGQRVDEKGRKGVVVALHTPGTVDVLFDDMDFAIRRQMPNVIALESNPRRSNSTALRYNGRQHRRNPMESRELDDLIRERDELIYIVDEGSRHTGSTAFYRNEMEEIARLNGEIERLGEWPEWPESTPRSSQASHRRRNPTKRKSRRNTMEWRDAWTDTGTVPSRWTAAKIDRGVWKVTDKGRKGDLPSSYRVEADSAQEAIALARAQTGPSALLPEFEAQYWRRRNPTKRKSRRRASTSKTFNTHISPEAVYIEAWDHPTIEIHMPRSSRRRKNPKMKSQRKKLTEGEWDYVQMLVPQFKGDGRWDDYIRPKLPFFSDEVLAAAKDVLEFRLQKGEDYRGDFPYAEYGYAPEIRPDDWDFLAFSYISPEEVRTRLAYIIREQQLRQQEELGLTGRDRSASPFVPESEQHHGTAGSQFEPELYYRIYSGVYEGEPFGPFDDSLKVARHAPRKPGAWRKGTIYEDLDNPRGKNRAIISRQNRRRGRKRRKLTMAQRERLPLSDFVFPDRAPGVGAYPINDLYHAKKALTMASWSEKGKSEMPYILDAVLRKYPQLENWKNIDRYYDIADEYSDRRIAANPAPTDIGEPFAGWEDEDDFADNPVDWGAWRERGGRAASSAWEGTKAVSGAAWKGTKAATAFAAHQTRVVAAKAKVSSAQNRIRSLKSCAKELSVSQSDLDKTQSMQNAQSALAKAKKRLEEVKADAPGKKENPRKRLNAGTSNMKKRQLRQEFREEFGPNWHKNKDLKSNFDKEWKTIRESK